LSSEKANAIGRSLEEERKQDIEFLLAQIRQNHVFRNSLEGTNPDYVFLAGYGAGGSAMVLLAGSPGFAGLYPFVKGIIAVESPILSALEREAPGAPDPAPRGRGWFRSLWAGIRGWAAEFRPKKITGAARVPGPQIPVLFLVSDRALTPKYRDKRYGTILRILHESEGPSVFAAINGAGPLDYSDVSGKYPLFSSLFSGYGEKPGPYPYFIQRTAALMANFSALLLEEASAEAGAEAPEEASAEQPESPVTAPQRIRFTGDIHIETGGTWNYGGREYIL
jgi:hypothetical protein